MNLFHRRHKIINVEELGTLQTLLYLGSGYCGIESLWHAVSLDDERGQEACTRFMDTRGLCRKKMGFHCLESKLTFGLGQITCAPLH